MLSPITGSLCRNMKRSLNKGKLSFSVNTKRSTMNDKSRDNSPENGHASQEEDHYGSDSENEWTAFKIMFKKYKKKRPPPDFSDVVDPQVENPQLGLTIRTITNKDVDDELFNKLGMRPPSEWKIGSFENRKGLFLIPNILKPKGDIEWMKRVVEYTEPPNRTNMDAHGTAPERDVLRNAGSKLRWTTLGVEYDWNTKEYPPTGRAIPNELVLFGRIISEVLGIGLMTPDTTIINYYPPKSALSPHVDRSERSKAPLISLSLGQSAVYLSGGMTLDEPVIPIWLNSGDVLVMHGEQRLVYHAIPCTKITKKFTIEEDKFLEEYLNNYRINMTIRQVNP